MMEREGAEIRRQKILGGELEDLAVEVAGRAAPVFRAMGWEWRDIGVPGEAQIAATLSRLISQAEEKDDCTMASGRFEVHHWWEDGWEQYSVVLELGSRLRHEDGTTFPTQQPPPSDPVCKGES